MVEREQWITQTMAAELRGMTLKAINALVARGRLRSREVYGRKLVHRDDVLAYQPKTKNRWSAGTAAAKKASTKKSTKKGKKK
jgi:hypothetical protein